MADALINFSKELAGVVQAVSPRVVSIKARRHYASSGVLWDSGAVVTADHTVQRDEDIAITLADGKSASATLVGRDSGTDLAVLRIESGTAPAAPLGRAAAVAVGELALVIGRSPESGVNASLGIVSATSGTWRTWRGGQLESYIRLDAKLFPQSSGGAVVNARGELIGIATSALSRIAGLAIPLATVERVAQKLLERGFVPRGYFGVGVQPVGLSDDLRKKLAISNSAGLIILHVEPNGPAEQAGILIGDILVRVGDEAIEHIDDLQAVSDSVAIGKAIGISFVRGGDLKQSTIALQERPGRRVK
jgi:S1-C subfamily serine protease